MARSRTTWKKGDSPNPGGRPKDDPAFIEACRERTPEALRVLDEAMANSRKKPDPAIRAAEIVLNRAWGTAPSTLKLDAKLAGKVEHEVKPAEPVKTEPSRLFRVAAVLLRSGAAIPGVSRQQLEALAGAASGNPPFSEPSTDPNEG